MRSDNRQKPLWRPSRAPQTPHNHPLGKNRGQHCTVLRPASGVRGDPDAVASVGHANPTDDDPMLVCGAEVPERLRRLRQISRYGYCLFDRGLKPLTGAIASVFDNRNSHVMTSQGTE